MSGPPLRPSPGAPKPSPRATARPSPAPPPAPEAVTLPPLEAQSENSYETRVEADGTRTHSIRGNPGQSR